MLPSYKNGSNWSARLAAKISAYSSSDLRKYQHLTGEDLGYKPSVLEQAKFDYFPLGNIFNKVVGKDDQKEGLFRRLENIKFKKEELLKAFSAANRVSKTDKNETDFNNDSRYAFYRFYRAKRILRTFERLQKSQTHRY